MMISYQMTTSERQVTHGPGGRILTHTGVWSPDGEWIVYDTRSDAAGEVFDGRRIEMVQVHTGEIRMPYESRHGAFCGVATYHPRDGRVVFILGPENPTPDWSYCAYHRQGVIVSANLGGPANSSRTFTNTAMPQVMNLDARDLTPPFTPGALRGGSHVHVWDSAGEWVSFTYEDHVLAQFREPGPDHDLNQRNVGVSIPWRATHVSANHPRNHDGQYFSVLITRTVTHPKPGSDEIAKACEEGWVGANGYLRADGTRQGRALAFQGEVITAFGKTISEVFIVDLPEDPTLPGDGPMAGTETRLPFPPKGTTQRRLTFTADSKYPGLQGPRHWLRSSPDGSHIAFLMKDEQGIAQLWTVSPNGGSPVQVTRNPWPVASAFTWSPESRFIAHVMDASVCISEVVTGQTHRLTPRCDAADAPRPEACVFSPDGRQIAYVRRIVEGGQAGNQIYVLSM